MSAWILKAQEKVFFIHQRWQYFSGDCAVSFCNTNLIMSLKVLVHLQTLQTKLQCTVCIQSPLEFIWFLKSLFWRNESKPEYTELHKTRLDKIHGNIVIYTICNLYAQMCNTSICPDPFLQSHITRVPGNGSKIRCAPSTKKSHCLKLISSVIICYQALL